MRPVTLRAHIGTASGRTVKSSSTNWVGSGLTDPRSDSTAPRMGWLRCELPLQSSRVRANALSLGNDLVPDRVSFEASA